MKGWKQDLTQITDFEDFPSQLKDYITYIEGEVKLPIDIVSIGPDRTQTIFRK